MRRALVPALAVALAGCTTAESPRRTETSARPFHLVPGSIVPNRGPDGNSIFVEVPDGLVLIDTGRHPEHRDKLLAYARERGRPIVAIVNTHWHYDHTTANGDILAAFPSAEVVASRAIDGRLYRDFTAKSRAGAEAYIAAGKATPAQRAEIERAFKVMDDPSALRAQRPVTSSGPRVIGGQQFEVHLEPYAVTEGDVWLFDRRTGVAFVGDLVVAPVPFLDTACVQGWREALSRVAAVPWTTLVPGHGAPMTRADFDTWHRAFNAFVDCGQSPAPADACAEAWVRDASAFIAEADRADMLGRARSYVQSRLRSADRDQFCPTPVPGSS